MSHLSEAIYINHAAANCSLGNTLADISKQLFNEDGQHPTLTFSDAYSPGKSLPLGLVTSPLAPVSIKTEDTRNNRLLASAVTPLLDEINRLKSCYGSHRIGLVIGTSTSGIAEGEAALTLAEDNYSLDPKYQYSSQEFSAPARFLSQWLGLDGPAWVVSTACTSGGKALASAARLLKLGVCDAVIAGGVDTLCHMTVAGFSSLTVTSESQCNPFSANRNGINIGEAAAVFIVSKKPGPVILAGVGESSDGYHISSPDPEGKGAELAMYRALQNADLQRSDIDYINLHGTATQQNDLMEALVVNRIFGENISCSSTKPLSGHTLAAAGAIEALFCWLLLQRKDNLLPPHHWDGVSDPDMPPMKGLGKAHNETPVRYAMSNSFAFGGNNLSLILAKA